MNTIGRALGLAMLFSTLSYGAPGGTISGTVTGPDGSSFRGAFVRAQNEKSKITVSVLSDKRGEYQIPKPHGGEVSGPSDGGGLQERPSR